MRIVVINWDKYNPRKDIKTMSWFRVESDIGFDVNLFKLTPQQKWVWIFILGLCAKENRMYVNTELEYLEMYSGVSIDDIQTTLDHLVKRKMVRYGEESEFEKGEIRTDTNEPVQIRTDPNEHERARTDPGPTGRDGTVRDVTNGTVHNGTDGTEKAPAKKRSTLPKIDYDRIKHEWNLMINKLEGIKMPRCESISKKREGYINVTSDKLFKSMSEWIRYFTRCSELDFLKGVGSTGWKADFEWVIKYDNALKVVEGKYDSVHPQGRGNAATSQTMKLLEDNPYLDGGSNEEI